MTDPVFPDVLLYAIPAFAVLVLLEYTFIRIRRPDIDFSWKDGLTSMSMGLGMTVSDILAKLIGFSTLIWFWQFRLFDLGTSVALIIITFIIGDFIYYWKHRFYHRMRWWWMSHNVHHSSEHYNLTTALRQPWTNHISGEFIIKVPLVLLGFHPLILIFVGALNLLYQFWIHTEVIDKCPKWFEAVFNTPSHHRVHHGKNPKYLDTNYAGTLIIWDKMFGTFVAEDPADPPDYGLVVAMESHNPFHVAFIELINIVKDATQRGLTLRQRLGYIFAPPGYSHDGSRKTSAQIQQDAGLTPHATELAE